MKKQGYNDELDDSLGRKHGSKKQNMAQRRADSENMEKAKDKRKFSGDKSMDEGKDIEEEMPTKMKKSELKEMIKAAMMAEGGNYYEDSIDEAEDVEVEDNEDVDIDIEKEVSIDDESVELDIEVDASMPGESGDEVAVQSLLMKAQEEAAKLGDEKLTDQIGNTITYFTRAHVAQVDESGVNEEEDYNSDVADISIDNPAEDAVVGLDESISRFKKLAGIIK